MERIVDISFRHKLSHLGSSLTAWPILKHIYETKKPRDLVVLSAGHAGLALYVALEMYECRDAEALLEKHGIHPCRDVDNGIHVSSGSLGSAVLVAVGLALGDPTRDVHVVLSDGECAEGSVWEALAFVCQKNVENIKIHVNMNGYSAYDPVDTAYLYWRLKSFWWPIKIWYTRPPPAEFLSGLRAHYHVMTEEHKDELIKYLNEEGIRQASTRPYVQGLKGLFNYCRSGVRDIGRYTKGLSRSIYQRWGV